MRALAADQPPGRDERCMRRRVLPVGRVKVELVLDPHEADLLMRAIDCARADGRRDKREDERVSAEDSKASAAWPSRADGAVALAESFLVGSTMKGNGGERYQVMVHLDRDVLAPERVSGGRSDETSEETWAATLDDGAHVSAEQRDHRL